MNELTHYMLHCASTPEGKPFTGDHILQWHMLPCKQADGTLKYKGKIYQTSEQLPDEKIGGLSVKKFFGSHGWTRPGYRKVLLLDASWQEIWPGNNEDDTVDGYEITNGILSTDPLYRHTQHMVYIGGMDATNKFCKDTRTAAQIGAMTIDVKNMISLHPNIKIIGHNQINDRGCPSFDVPKWCRSIGVDEKNIDSRPIIFKGPL